MTPVKRMKAKKAMADATEYLRDLHTVLGDDKAALAANPELAELADELWTVYAALHTHGQAL